MNPDVTFVSENTEAGNKFLEECESSGNYNAFCGAGTTATAVNQFVVLTSMGLHEDCHLLDVGCGGLTGGKLFMPFLKPGHYFGIEPTEWVLDGACKEFKGLIDDREPELNGNKDFECDVFTRKEFDFILAYSIFSHAPRWMIEKACKNIAKVMHNNSRFVGTYFKGFNKLQYKGDEWIYPRGVFHTVETMHNLFHKAGLKFTSMPIAHPERQQWFVATK